MVRSNLRVSRQAATALRPATTHRQNTWRPRVDVVVTEKDMDNVRMELRAGADMKCMIRIDRLRNEVHDRPEGAWQSGPVKATVMLRSVDGGASSTIVATQDSSGGPLRMLDIPPGRYWVDVANLPKDFYVKWIRFGEQDVDSRSVESQPRWVRACTGNHAVR